MLRVLKSALAAGLALGGAALLLVACGEGDGPAQAPPLEVVVTAAERRDVPLSIEMVGSLRGTQDVPIRARVEGFLESMEFQEGTFVNEGDLLYTIDPQPFAARLVEAQSQLAAAQTQLAKAEADLARIRPLADMNAVSKQDLDSAVAQDAAARAGVQAAEAAVDLAEIELSYTRIVAPISGLIGLSQAKPGEFVGREPNPVVLNMLSDIDPIRVRFSISEREYLILARTYLSVSGRKSIRAGGRKNRDLELLLADGSLHPHKGEVVAASQSIDPETGTYSVEAAFPNPDRVLLPGQFARVRALYQVLEDAVVIPRQAVSEIQGLFRVYTVGSDGTVAAQEIELGPETGYDVVVESGLDSGVDVIVEGLQRVRPGMTVKASRMEPPSPAEPSEQG
jgi:membrane fusion protein (multidrug efflux system)